jgi:hypothetical protein
MSSSCSYLSDAWNITSSAPDTIEHPQTGITVPVRVKALKFVDGTYVLEGKVRTCDTPVGQS